MSVTNGQDRCADISHLLKRGDDEGAEAKEDEPVSEVELVEFLLRRLHNHQGGAAAGGRNAAEKQMPFCSKGKASRCIPPAGDKTLS